MSRLESRQLADRYEMHACIDLDVRTTATVSCSSFRVEDNGRVYTALPFLFPVTALSLMDRKESIHVVPMERIRYTRIRSYVHTCVQRFPRKFLQLRELDSRRRLDKFQLAPLFDFSSSEEEQQLLRGSTVPLRFTF